MTHDFELAAELIRHAPARFEAMADDWGSEDKRLAVENLEAMAFAATWRAAYVEQRYGSGCGDQGHESAVTHANRVLAKVRKAMGYYVTHPVRV